MFTASEFSQVKQLLSGLDSSVHVYGGATINKLEEGTYKILGNSIINNHQEKPVNYFIDGENICGYHYSVVSHLMLTIAGVTTVIENKKK